MSISCYTSEQSSSRFWLYSFWAVLLLAFVSRWTMSVTGYASTFDTGTPGLMAVNILKGERPLFFYGQHYMGALEAYLAALLFSLFGISETVKTLSPILFSLGWIAATYALFTECLNRKAGFAAALVLAYPGWQTLWYNIGTYGGYPGAFFFGTLVLWLSVRTLKRCITGRALLLYMPCISLLAGLGLWTNYICGAYLGLAAILLVIHKLKIVGFRQDNLPYLLALLPFLVAVSPVLNVALHSGGGEQVASFSFGMNEIKARVNLMTSNLLPELFYWPFRFSEASKTLLALLLVPGLAVSGVAFWRPAKGLDRKWMLIPVYFVIIYLLLYLPHNMASIRASRYLIPGYSIFLCMVFSYGFCAQASGWRCLAGITLLGWTAYNAFSSIHMMDLRAEKTRNTRLAREEVIQACDRLDITEVHMVDGYAFGHLGQAYSYLSEGRIAFGSVLDERHPRTSQALEVPRREALLSKQSNALKVRDSLRTLGVSFKRKETKALSLFYDLDVSPSSGVLIPNETVRIRSLSSDEDCSPALGDRSLSTYMETGYGKKNGLLVDLGSLRSVNRIWLTSPEYKQSDLPKEVLLQSSMDGETWTNIYDRHARVSLAYNKGNRVYFLGYRGVMEYNFPATEARYLKLTFIEGSDPESPIRISELLLFESRHSPQGSLEDDLDIMEKWLQDNPQSFLTADRWVSGSLYERPGLKEKVLPRYNPKFPTTQPPEFLTMAPGRGLAVDRALADETGETLLKIAGSDGQVERIDLNFYTLFYIQNFSPAIQNRAEAYQFNGHFVEKRDEAGAEVP